jgi:hypothetical protein
MGAAQLHMKRARELMETGTITDFDPNFPEKPDLLEMGLYDDLIRDWAKKTGKPFHE